MASITLAGILKDSIGQIDVGAIVTFTHLTTTGQTIKGTSNNLIVAPDGAYSINLEYGQIRIDYTTKFTERFVAIVVVNSDSTATNLPDLLNAAVPPTNAQLLQFQNILADTVTAKNAAVVAESGAQAAEATLLATTITTTALIASTVTFPASTVINTTGFTTSADGGKGGWKQNGLTGQPVSRTPAQLNNNLLNDGNGAQWSMILNNTVEFDTFANLELSTIGNIYQRLVARDNLNAEYILQPSTYSAVTGDATLANGLVAKLAIEQRIVKFDNIAAMKAGNLVVGDAVLCKRYYAGGDLVDGLSYVVVASGTGVDDGGSFHNLTNGTQAQLIVGSLVDIKKFGCVIGNVLNNLTLQSAINFCVASGKILHVSRGTYIYTVPMVASGALKIQGDTRTVSFLLPVGCDGLHYTAAFSGCEIKDLAIKQAVRYTDTPNSFTAIKNLDNTNKSQYYIFENIRIDGFETALAIDRLWNTKIENFQVLFSHVGIVASLSVLVHIDNSEINVDSSAGSRGLVCATHSEGFFISNTLFFGCEIGILGVSCSDMFISNCQFDFQTLNGIYAFATANDPRNHGWHINNTYFAMSGTAGDAAIRFDTEFNHPSNGGNSVSNNKIITYQGTTVCNYGIRLFGAFCRFNTIVGNNIAFITTDDIFEQNGSSNNTYTGNYTQGSVQIGPTAVAVNQNFNQLPVTTKVDDGFITPRIGGAVTALNGTPITLFAGDTTSAYLVTAWQTDGAATRTATTQFISTTAPTLINNITLSAQWVLSLSGNNIQITNTSGASRGCTFSAIKLF